MTQTIELDVQGMTCDHCVRAVTGAIKSIDGVNDASVDLEGHHATLTGNDVDIAAVIAAIEEEGYEAKVA